MKFRLTMSVIAKTLLKVGLLLAVTCGVAFAATPTAITLSKLSGNVDTSVKSLATVLSDVALIAGVGFVMAAFFKFHQHKLNPTQVPISQGITLLLIGAGLMLFPTMLPTATHAIFGKASIDQTGGSQIGSLIGGNTK